MHAGRIVEINSGKLSGRWTHGEPFPGKGGREDPGQPQEDPRAGGEGFKDGFPKEGDRVQATEVRLLQELLRAFGDPDHYFCEWWSRGVWLGSPERPLPRAPALYARKSKWPLKDDSTQLHGDCRTNYSSIRDHEAQVEGLIERITLGEALERYDEKLVIAATGAIAKKGAELGGDIRVIFNDTNGVYLNLGIRTRDQVRSPTACDIKTVLAELAEEGGVHWSLLFDVSKAHRRIPVLEEEWGRQACQIRGMAAATAGLKRAQTAFRLGIDRPGEATPLRRSDFSHRELFNALGHLSRFILVVPLTDLLASLVTVVLRNLGIDSQPARLTVPGPSS